MTHNINTQRLIVWVQIPMQGGTTSACQTVMVQLLNQATKIWVFWFSPTSIYTQ